jgi:hemin uptake protein HemP
MSVILKNILKLQKDFISSENYLSKEEVISLVSKTRSVFNKKTVWNNPDQKDEKKRISSNCLFGFKSGIIITKDGIYILQDTQLRTLLCFPFRKKIIVYEGGGWGDVPKYKSMDLTMLKVVDDWDYPIGWIKGVSEGLPDIIINGSSLYTEGVFSYGKFLNDDEVRFFNTLQSKLKEISDDKEKLRVIKLKKSHNKILFELDKDGNGEVDVVEGNDFDKLLKKHQKSILKIDRNYIQKFVKVSSYLKLKKENIQSIFNSIKYTQDQMELNEYVDILKDEIHTYNLILFNSLNMIVSLVEDDLITFYEIYEMFDNINMFDSKYEKDVSQKLTNIGDGLRGLMFEIRDMGNKISNSIQELSYVTKETTSMLKNSLGEINSSLDTNNLLTMIQTYQTYKLNQNTKSLRE